MKLNAYSIRDIKTDIFAAPWFVPSDGIALRLMRELVQDKRSDLGKYPEDFTLHYIGTYDTSTAVMESSISRLVCTAIQCLPSPLAPVVEAGPVSPAPEPSLCHEEISDVALK